MFIIDKRSPQVPSISTFSIEGVDLTKAILGCDSFISWIYQGGGSSFKASGGVVDSLKTYEVVKVSLDQGVRSLDLSPPLVDVFNRLRKERREKIEALGALQEWICTNFTIGSIPLANYAEEIKATICSMLPSSYLQNLKSSESFESSFARSFFLPENSARPLTASQIDSIKMKSEFFKERLAFYRDLDVNLVQFGGGAADWLVALGRTDLLEDLNRLIRKSGFIPLLVCHCVSHTLPIAERELDVAGYIVPLNRLWSLLSLSDSLDVIKRIRKPIIAMKPLSQGFLAYDIEGAFTFLFKKVGVTAVLVGVSSVTEAKKTFSAIRKIARG
jgi:hypothetical protein